MASSHGPFPCVCQLSTQGLKPNTLVCLVDSSLDEAQKRLLSYQGLTMINFAKWVIPADEEIAEVLQQAASGPQVAIDLVKNIDTARKPFVFRALAWLLKLGILKILP